MAGLAERPRELIGRMGNSREKVEGATQAYLYRDVFVERFRITSVECELAKMSE